MAKQAVSFLAILLTALALVPSGAHLMEIFVKMQMSRADYFTVQSIYRGWSLSGAVIFAALASNAAAAWLRRKERARFYLSLAACLSLVSMLAIFFIWTYPANQATANWTTQPADWLRLRRDWEYSHAASALATLTALACATAAGIGRK